MPMVKLFDTLSVINDWLWTYVVVSVLVLCALYFTVRSRGVQFRLLTDMFKIMAGRPIFSAGESSRVRPSDVRIGRIGSFHAFAVSLSSRVGTGNLAGVASAICIGGPGAVFWMWVMALLGASTAFVESTLAQFYKLRGKDSFYGGPAYYMRQGLRRGWMGVLFAVLITFTFGIANQTVQSNTLCAALADALSVDIRLVGGLLSLATLLIIFGGVRRISRFAAIVVPVMAVGYVLTAVVVIGLNISRLPDTIMLIVRSAFGLEPAAGGAVGMGVVMMQGVKRGLFSNEAGEGSAPNAAAIAHTSHPVKQGLVQSLGVFTDTLLVCSCTAFIILLSGLYDSGMDGILLTKYALQSHIGPTGGLLVTIAIFLFAYSTIIANYFYGETNIMYVTRRGSFVTLFRIFTVFTVFAGSMMTLQEAWSVVDVAMGLMTLVNLVAIVELSPKVFALLDNYMMQRRQGRDPVFHKKDLPQYEHEIECWE